MDNVCHTLVGAAMAEAGLKRHSAYASATLMIAANIPDLDVLVFVTDTPGNRCFTMRSDDIFDRKSGGWKRRSGLRGGSAGGVGDCGCKAE